MTEWDIKYVVYSPSGYGEWVAKNGNEKISEKSLEALTSKLSERGQK